MFVFAVKGMMSVGSFLIMLYTTDTLLGAVKIVHERDQRIAEHIVGLSCLLFLIFGLIAIWSY